MSESAHLAWWKSTTHTRGSRAAMLSVVLYRSAEEYTISAQGAMGRLAYSKLWDARKVAVTKAQGSAFSPTELGCSETGASAICRSRCPVGTRLGLHDPRPIVPRPVMLVMLSRRSNKQSYGDRTFSLYKTPARSRKMLLLLELTVYSAMRAVNAVYVCLTFLPRIIIPAYSLQL
jgi:hypothetical protein